MLCPHIISHTHIARQQSIPPVEDDGCRDVYVNELEGEYQWIREYHREKKETEDERRTYLLRQGESEVRPGSPASELMECSSLMSYTS